MFEVNHNITRHSEIASTRELQVLFEASGVVFLEVFTKVKDSYNFPSFKVWGKFVMTKFNSNHIFVPCIYFEEAIPESCLLSDFVFLKICWLRRFSQMILFNYSTSTESKKIVILLNSLSENDPFFF